MMQARVALMAFSFLLSVTAAGDTTTGRCPLLVERCLTYATGISVSLASDGSSGVYAYVGAGEILKIVDVSNAAKPVVVESLVLSDDITTIVAREDFVYVWMVDGSLRVVDVRNPRAPQEFGSLEDEGTSGWVDVEISGGFAFVSPHSMFGSHDPVARIQVIDLRNPSAPIEVASFEGRWGSISISEGRLLALSANSPEHGWSLHVIDVSHPEEPAAVGSYQAPLGSRAFDLATEGTFAYVATDSGLLVLDVSDPSRPFELTTLDMPVSWTLAIGDGYLYAQASNDFHVVDVRDPSNPIEVGFCDIPYTYIVKTDMVVADGHVLLAHGYHGLVVVDVTFPNDPQMAGQLCGGWIYDVEVSGNRAYWLYRAWWRTGMRISDVSDPCEPIVIGCYETDDWLRKIVVSGSHAYLAADDSGLLVIDVSDPSDPREISSFETKYRIVDAAIRDAHLFLLEGINGVQGLRILDVSDPTDPRELGWHTQIVSGSPRGLAISENRAFITTSSRLTVVDVSDPSSPYEIASLEVPAGPISISRSRAFLAAGKDGLRVINISEPSAPYEVGSTVIAPTADQPAEAISITVSGRHAYVGTKRSGLHIIDVSRPRKLLLVGTFPDGRYPDGAREIAVRGAYAFVADGSDGSCTLDINGCRKQRLQNHRDHSGPH